MGSAEKLQLSDSNSLRFVPDEDVRLLKPPKGQSVTLTWKAGRISLRLLRRDEVEKARRLYRLAGEPVPSAEIWDWRFFQRNPGLSNVLAAFSEDKELIGLYPGTVRPVYIHGQELLCFQACRTLVHPKYRGGGRVYIGFLRFCFAYLESMGIPVGIGGGAGEAALKVGAWVADNREMCALTTYERRLSWRLAARSRLGFLGKPLSWALDAGLHRPFRSRNDGWTVEPVQQMTAEFDDLWLRKRDRYQVLLRRDARELQWRYFDCPVPATILAARKQGVLQGFAVLRHRQDDMGEARLTSVIDMFSGQDPEVEVALLQAAGAEGIRQGSDFLQFAPSLGSVSELLVSQKPWRPARRPLEHVIVSETTKRAEEVGIADLTERAIDGRQWYYCQGDSDFFD
ncbi:MAG: GNAT family N-acetyltransferase [Planctomycetota bacterium]|nr:MAG: GNAT family N-acetyltransferase [Planctomycetota bacterium]